MQAWVGNLTIYRAENEARVEAAHTAVLTNAPIGGRSWSATGMNGTNLRVGAVWLADALHRNTGLTVPAAYQLVDTLALIVALLLLLGYLGQAVGPPLALIGVMAFATLLPLTYQLFFYHPWDRLSLVMWVALLWLLMRERLRWFTLLLPVAVLIKYDVILLPLLHGLHRLLRDRRVTRRTIMETAGMMMVSFGSFRLLKLLRPGGAEPRPVIDTLRHNMDVATHLGVRWPPLLAFALPAVLIIPAFRRLDAWSRAGALFSIGLLGIFATLTNFAEVRAQMPVLLLLLPGALQAFEQAFEQASTTVKIG
jgi:hypothetical protein